MKIGIITSGNDNLALFSFLTKYDHEYIVYYDFSHWPYGDRPFEESGLAVSQGIDFLSQQGVEKIILPPVYELSYLAEGGKMKDKRGKTEIVLPLFTTYLMDYCFKYSLVGKIGFFGDYADVQMGEKFLHGLEKEYQLTPTQQAIRKFHSPFAYRGKETTLWKYYLVGLSYSHMMVNKLIKFDLRYFKDAMVDMVIPLNYGYFHYQKTIEKFLNFKKIRFHGIEKVEHCFTSLISASPNKPIPNKPIPYSVKVYYTGHTEFLAREKRLLRLLQRGKSVEVKVEKIA